MSAQVHPSSQANSVDYRKSSGLRGEASLGQQTSQARPSDTHGENRAEFDILLAFLDTDSNGKVSALELADFVDSLLSTQDHTRPQGSIVFEAVLLCALRFSVGNKDPVDSGPVPGQRPPPPPPPLPLPVAESGRWMAGSGNGAKDGGGLAGLGAPSQQLLAGGGPELHEYASQRFLSMESVRSCFADLLADTDLWLRLAASYSVMTTALFRQLLQYSAGGLEKKFSFGVFVKAYAAFNALPLWLPFPFLWRGSGQHGILLSVYLHQLAKLHQQLGPWVSSRVDMHLLLVVLTVLQFTASWLPLVAFFAAHGVPAMWQASSVVGWMHANPLPLQISFFNSILPFAALQFLTSSGALKISCRDFASLKEQCKAVFLLGDVSSQLEAYPGLTIRTVMDRIKGRVEESVRRSAFRKITAVMPLVFGVSLEVFRRLVRVFLVHNWIAAEVLGKVVAPFEAYALIYNIWFAYSESADCTQYLFLLKKTSNTFRTLLSKEEALSQSLPWLNNHSPRNLLLWSRLRRYYQSPNCLELRWIEMHLTLVVVAALAMTIILIVTIVQKQLLRFTPENADLQLFVVWVIPAFIYLLAAMIVDVIMSASTGAEYHDGIMTLSAESVAIADRLNSADEIARYEACSDPDGDPSVAAAGGRPASPSRRVSSLSGADSGAGSMRRREVPGSAGQGVAALVAAGAGALSMEGERGRWRPAEHCRLATVEREKLRQCQDIIRSLVAYIQFNAEYITLFGVPIDTHLRNTLFSVSVTLVGAGISAFLAIVVRR